MNMIELHILQSFPVTCLNRDDVGAPKSAVFGGVQRARVSSQSWKRAIRTMAKEYAPDFFAGQRTRYVVKALESLFSAKVADAVKAHALAEATADAVGKLDNPKEGNVKTLLFFSPQELDAVVEAVLGLDISDELMQTAHGDDKKKAEKAQKELSALTKKAAKSLSSSVKDAADIAIFGRMVADDHTLTLEGAGLFSHALSTHAVSNELDFFSAVDDNKPDADDAGAGHIGSLEFNAACYYRYVGVNLGLLEKNLSEAVSDEERKSVLSTFLRAAVLAVPSARKNSMFGFNPPLFILGVRRGGQPISLVNAFEKPVKVGEGGYAEASKTALDEHWKTLKALYCLQADVEVQLPPDNLDDFITKLI